MSIHALSLLKRTLGRLLLGFLLAGCVAAAVGAGCPHCEAIVKVEVALSDGSTRQGYFEYHPEILPSITGADGTTKISLEHIPADFYRSDKIRLLDTVFVLPQLGKFARLSDTDSIPVADIKSMMLESWLTKPSADRVHMVTARELDELGSPDLVRFDTTIDLSVVHYVGPGDSVSVEKLEHLAKNRDFLGGQQDRIMKHLVILINEMKNRVSDSDFAEYLDAIVDQTRSALIADQARLDSLSEDGVIGRHFAVVRDHVVEWTGFLTAVLKYLREDDRQSLDAEIARNLSAGRLPSDIGDHPYEVGGEVSRAGMTYLLQAYVSGNRISAVLGPDYDRDLNAHSVHIIEQAFD